MPLTNFAVKNAKAGEPPVKKERDEKLSRPVRQSRDGSGASNKDPEKPKPYGMFDGGGLYLEVRPSGGKWWRWKYRAAEKEKRLSLGVYPEISLAGARRERDECGKLLARGIDPAEQRKAMKMARKDRTADSFEVVAREWLQNTLVSGLRRVHAFPREFRLLIQGLDGEHSSSPVEKTTIATGESGSHECLQPDRYFCNSQRIDLAAE